MAVKKNPANSLRFMISFLVAHIFSSINVLDVVDVNVTEQDETLDVVGMVSDELVEEGRRLERSVVVGQQQCQIEKRRAEVLSESDGLPEPVLGAVVVVVVHGQHAQVEENSLVLIGVVFAEQLQQPLPGQLAQLRSGQLLQQDGRVEQRLLVVGVDFERLVQVRQRLRCLSLLQEYNSQLMNKIGFEINNKHL